MSQEFERQQFDSQQQDDFLLGETSRLVKQYMKTVDNEIIENEPLFRQWTENWWLNNNRSLESKDFKRFLKKAKKEAKKRISGNRKRSNSRWNRQ